MLARRGVKRGDTVSVVLANTPAMVEAHYGVPMAGAVLNTLNTRLDGAILGFTLDHAESKVLIVDREYSKVMKEALAGAKAKPLIIDYDDPEFTGSGDRLGSLEYEEFLREGDPDFGWQMPGDEWDEAIELAQDGMAEHGANFARILNDDGVEVWSGRKDTERA